MAPAGADPHAGRTGPQNRHLRAWGALQPGWGGAGHLPETGSEPRSQSKEPGGTQPLLWCPRGPWPITSFPGTLSPGDPLGPSARPGSVRKQLLGADSSQQPAALTRHTPTCTGSCSTLLTAGTLPFARVFPLVAPAGLPCAGFQAEA